MGTAGRSQRQFVSCETSRSQLNAYVHAPHSDTMLYYCYASSVNFITAMSTVVFITITFNKTCNVVVQREKQSTSLDLCASSVHSNQALCKQLLI